MQYRSTRSADINKGFAGAVIDGLAPDGGLYVPDHIPAMSHDEITSARSLPELAHRFLTPYTADALSTDRLRDICEDAFNFEIPLVEVEKGIYSLELFHGPTLAFKDVGARFMGRVLPECNASDEEITVLVATSGDTGGAVANGLYGVDGVRVVVLYPDGKVSPLQEKQFAALGGNVQALAVDGVFDDCQRLVKAAFKDPQITQRLRLTTANSINIARWIPQAIYYLWAYKQLGEAPVFSVPSGNFGNFTAGVLAWRTGLPVDQFVAACNANDTVPSYLLSGEYRPQPSVETVANAMDVGDPSNFERLTLLFDHDIEAVRSIARGVAYPDEEILKTIRDCHSRTGYLLDPHGACGYRAIITSAETSKHAANVFLATAHPAKFAEVYYSIGMTRPIHPRLEALRERPLLATAIPNDLKVLRDILLVGH